MKSVSGTRLARWCVAAAAVSVALVLLTGSAWAAGPATQLAVVQEPASSTAGVLIAPHFTVQLRDALGDDVLSSGVSVSVALTSGTGTLLGTTTRDTDANGTVAFDDLSIQTAGTNKQLTASSESLTPVVSSFFDIIAGAPANLSFDVEPSDAAAGVAIAPAVRVKVTDTLGNPIPTELVSLSLVGSGTLSGYAPTNTDANGIATFSNLSVDLVGTKHLSALTTSLGPVSSTNFVISAGTPANLSFDVQPSDVVAGVAFAPPVRVKVTDALGNPIATELVSLLLVGSGTLSGYAPTNTDANGIATFSTLSVNLAGTKHLNASTTSLGPVSSTNFVISAGAAANLSFDVQPSSAMAGATIAPAVRVKVTDSLGNPIPTDLVSLSLVGSGTLSGYAPTNTDANGIATFSTLSVNLAGTKHLNASTTSLGPVSSTNFVISAGSAANLSFDVQPTNALPGATIMPAVRVKVTDSIGNPIVTELVSLSLVGSGTLSGYAPTNTDANGIATFSTLSVNLAGTKRLSASTSSLGPVLSVTFDITCPTITLAPTSLPAATVGTPYSQTVSASGGGAPYGYAVTLGSLPGGLALNGGTGEISGTPSASGTFNFTITVTDAAGCTGSRAYSLGSCPTIAIVPGTLPNGSIGVAYSQSLTASAGTAPFTWSITSGALPGGLSLSSGGLLAGTPTASGTFGFTVRVVDANACSGSQPFSLTILAAPAAVTNLTATQLLAGNDGDGTTKIQIAFTLPPGAASVEVYRAGFGHYPFYDDAGGGVPVTPPYPPAAPWVLTGIASSGQTDETTTRDFQYYVMFTKNAAGGVSPVSNKTGGTLNYHLGDVSNGFTAGQGNNLVGNEDISLLGANYGIGAAAITSRGVAYLDVGPTTDLLLTSRPFTDNRIDFEDFIIFASNYGVVSSPQLAARAARVAAAAASGPEDFRVVAPALVRPGETVEAQLWLRGAGRVQGFSATLAWDATVVEPLETHSSGFLEGQGGLVLSPGPGGVDGALLGVRERGMVGEGEVARVGFRVLRAGSPGFRLARLEARDAANRPIGAEGIEATVRPERPLETLLLAPAPNPSRGAAGLVFSLASAGAVELTVYAVDGRRVRTLVRERREAGVYRVDWDGRDEGRNAVAPGVYYARLSAAGRQLTKTLVRLK